MANITEIAHRLKIAPSTVSRALKKPSLVSLETRHKVLQMAEQLGYLQKLRDEATVATSSKLIGIITADLTNSFSNQIVKSVHDTLEAAGYSAIVGCNYEHSGYENKLLKQWASLNLLGLIVMPSAKFAKTVSNIELNMPIVLVDRDCPELPYDSVIEDNRFGAMQALEHLTSLGHSRIAFISGSRSVYTFDERCKGIEESAINAEIYALDSDAYDDLVIGAFEQTNIIMMRNKNQRPTAIIGANNAITSGILYALSLKNFKIPDDVSVVSYGDSNWCRFYPTPITSICQPVEEMGRVAANLLLERISGKAHVQERICLKSMLMRRASTTNISC
jgi:DNA-binding LacI/PurR family transcriptional regulator